MSICSPLVLTRLSKARILAFVTVGRVLRCKVQPVNDFY